MKQVLVVFAVVCAVLPMTACRQFEHADVDAATPNQDDAAVRVSPRPQQPSIRIAAGTFEYDENWYDDSYSHAHGKDVYVRVEAHDTFTSVRVYAKRQQWGIAFVLSIPKGSNGVGPGTKVECEWWKDLISKDSPMNGWLTDLSGVVLFDTRYQTLGIRFSLTGLLEGRERTVLGTIRIPWTYELPKRSAQ